MPVAICFQFLGPYHVARISAAARLMDVVGIEFSVATSEYAWSRSDEGLSFRRIVAFREGDIRKSKFFALRRHIWNALDEAGPDTVAVPGWGSAESLAAIGWAQQHRIPVVVMSETTSWDAARRPIGEFVKRRVLMAAQAALVGGAPHAAYAASLGIRPDRIFTGYDVVDNDYFSELARASRARPKPGNLPRGRYFLASSRFIPKKNLLLLFEAFSRFRETNGDDWGLVVVGDGPMRNQLEARRNELGLDTVIHLPGFIQYAELPEYYAWADAFIHASTTEQWGLVVNEAMACALPVLVSARCGCVADLVSPGRNGAVFDPADVGDMAKAMAATAADASAREQMGRESARIISAYTPSHFAQALLRAVDAARQQEQLSTGVLDRLLVVAAAWQLARRQ